MSDQKKALQETLKLVRKVRGKQYKTTKAESQKVHAMKRFKERYGFDITTKQYNEMCSLVRNKKAVLLEKQSIRVRKMRINYLDRTIYFCYDTERHKINTFLKPEWFDGDRHIKPGEANA